MQGVERTSQFGTLYEWTPTGVRRLLHEHQTTADQFLSER